MVPNQQGPGIPKYLYSRGHASGGGTLTFRRRRTSARRIHQPRRIHTTHTTTPPPPRTTPPTHTHGRSESLDQCAADPPRCAPTTTGLRDGGAPSPTTHPPTHPPTRAQRGLTQASLTPRLLCDLNLTAPRRPVVLGPVRGGSTAPRPDNDGTAARGEVEVAQQPRREAGLPETSLRPCVCGWVGGGAAGACVCVVWIRRGAVDPPRALVASTHTHTRPKLSTTRSSSAGRDRGRRHCASLVQHPPSGRRQTRFSNQRAADPPGTAHPQTHAPAALYHLTTHTRAQQVSPKPASRRGCGARQTHLRGEEHRHSLRPPSRRRRTGAPRIHTRDANTHSQSAPTGPCSGSHPPPSPDTHTHCPTISKCRGPLFLGSHGPFVGPFNCFVAASRARGACCGGALPPGHAGGQSGGSSPRGRRGRL